VPLSITRAKNLNGEKVYGEATMKIAITGGAGFIGSHLTQAYLDAGHDVIIIDNLAYGEQQQAAIDPRARFYKVDIRDRKLHTILQHERPDIVSHHAAQTLEVKPAYTLTHADLHVRGLLNVLDGCISADVKKIIFASGGNDMYAYPDAHHTSPMSEEHPLYPRSAQDISKIAGEWYVRYYTQQHRLDHSILRYADVYGEVDQYGQRLHHPLSTMIYALMQQQRPIIRSSSNAVRDHIFIDDVVNANLKLLKRGGNQTFHISSGMGYTLDQLYHLVAHAMESKIEPIYISTTEPIPPTIILDNSLACKTLDWQPEVSLMTGIHLAIHRLHAKNASTERNTDKLAPLPIEQPQEQLATELAPA
jgi:UDP-glucose 4-epimerase